MPISIHDHPEFLHLCTFEHKGHQVGELRTGTNGDQTELLMFDHVDELDALMAFDAYTRHTCGWALSEEYPTGWRIEHAWAVLNHHGEDALTVQVLNEQPAQPYAKAFPVTRWTDEEVA